MSPTSCSFLEPPGAILSQTEHAHVGQTFTAVSPEPKPDDLVYQAPAAVLHPTMSFCEHGVTETTQALT